MGIEIHEYRRKQYNKLAKNKIYTSQQVLEGECKVF